MAYTFDTEGRPILATQIGPGTQYTVSAGATSTITAESGATRLELIVEEGILRVRSDGGTPTLTTGEPMWPGDRRTWGVTTLSVLAVGVDTIVTSMSR